MGNTRSQTSHIALTNLAIFGMCCLGPDLSPEYCYDPHNQPVKLIQIPPYRFSAPVHRLIVRSGITSRE